MNTRLTLWVSVSLLVAAIGCSDSSTDNGNGGMGGIGGEAGMGGIGGVGGEGGMGGGGVGGEGGVGGTAPKGNCHSSVPPLLSDWGLFSDIRTQEPAEGVLPYEVTSPLFTDYALKRRFVTLSKGGQIEYFNDSERWQSPVGSIYAKTFAYPPNLEDPDNDGLEQLIETRIMVHVAAEDDRLGCSGSDSCWQTHVYVYNEEMTDAVCESGGATVSVAFTNPLFKACSDDQNRCETDEDCPGFGMGATCDYVQESVPDYGVPSNGACRRCHGVEPTRTLGPSTGMLNRGNDYQGVVVPNQIDQFYQLGLLDKEPPPDPEDRTTYVDPTLHVAECQTDLCIHDAARSWFDSNCSQCHAPDGEAAGTGLHLDWASMNPDNPSDETFKTWGVCKLPTSAGGVKNCPGGEVDIVPGEPDASVMLCRIDSVTPGEMMAPLGRTLIDVPGSDVIRAWITILPSLFPEIPTCSTAGTGGTGGAGI